MAEIITEPDHSHVIHSYEENKSGSGVALLAIAIVVLLAIVFFYYALPFLSGARTTTNLNVPDKVNVNVNRTP